MFLREEKIKSASGGPPGAARRVAGGWGVKLPSHQPLAFFGFVPVKAKPPAAVLRSLDSFSPVRALRCTHYTGEAPVVGQAEWLWLEAQRET